MDGADSSGCLLINLAFPKGLSVIMELRGSWFPLDLRASNSIYLLVTFDFLNHA